VLNENQKKKEKSAQLELAINATSTCIVSSLAEWRKNVLKKRLGIRRAGRASTALPASTATAASNVGRSAKPVHFVYLYSRAGRTPY